MALAHRIILNFKPAFLARSMPARNCSNRSSIKKSVFISQSKDIYTNLALQDWIYKNLDLTNQHVLMLWQNDPCVLLGKRQNPWLEVDVENLPSLTESGVKLARQRSDGASIYQDAGSLNLTFFTNKERFNEIYNMEVVSRALFREAALKVNIDQGELTMRGGNNISSSSKLIGTTNAYHHCSLMVHVNKVDLIQTLTKQEFGIQSENNQLKVMNICEENFNVNVKSLLRSIGWEYLRTPATLIKDGGDLLASRQNGFQMVNPSENWFPGIDKIREELSMWNWVYGQTPTFKVTRKFRDLENLGHHHEDLIVEISVSNGYVKNFTLSLPFNSSSSHFRDCNNIIASTIIGRKFSREVLIDLENSVKTVEDEKEKFGTKHLKQALSSF